MDPQVIAAMARWPNVPDVHGWLSLSRQGVWRLHPQGRGWTVGSAHAADAEGADTPDAGRGTGGASGEAEARTGGGAGEGLGAGPGGQADTEADTEAGAETDDSAADPGEAITNPQIIDFIGRNYAGDDRGRWYFQNGPQRVYVRLDGAPWILRTDRDARGGLLLRTHTGRPYGPVTHWWLDEDGRLYAQAGQGAGLVSGRDMAEVIDALLTPEGQPLAELLEAGASAIPALRLGAPDPSNSSGAPADTIGKSAVTFAPLGTIPAQGVEATLGFVRRPMPQPAGKA